MLFDKEDNELVTELQTCSFLDISLNDLYEIPESELAYRPLRQVHRIGRCYQQEDIDLYKKRRDSKEKPIKLKGLLHEIVDLLMEEEE